LYGKVMVKPKGKRTRPTILGKRKKPVCRKNKGKNKKKTLRESRLSKNKNRQQGRKVKKSRLPQGGKKKDCSRSNVSRGRKGNDERLPEKTERGKRFKQGGGPFYPKEGSKKKRKKERSQHKRRDIPVLFSRGKYL